MLSNLDNSNTFGLNLENFSFTTFYNMSMFDYMVGKIYSLVKKRDIYKDICKHCHEALFKPCNPENLGRVGHKHDRSVHSFI